MSTPSTPLKLNYVLLGRDNTFTLRADYREDISICEVLKEIGPELGIPSGLDFWLVCDNTTLDWTNG